MEVELKPVPLTNPAIVVLRTLEGGPQKWGKLRLAYFGEGRAKLPASTAFHTKSVELIGKGLIKKDDATEMYELTPLGKVSIEAVPEATKMAAKSDAQIKWDATEAGKAFWAAKAAASEGVAA